MTAPRILRHSSRRLALLLMVLATVLVASSLAPTRAHAMTACSSNPWPCDAYPAGQKATASDGVVAPAWGCANNKLLTFWGYWYCDGSKQTTTIDLSYFGGSQYTQIYRWGTYVYYVPSGSSTPVRTFSATSVWYFAGTTTSCYCQPFKRNGGG